MTFAAVLTSLRGVRTANVVALPLVGTPALPSSVARRVGTGFGCPRVGTTFGGGARLGTEFAAPRVGPAVDSLTPSPVTRVLTSTPRVLSPRATPVLTAPAFVLAPVVSTVAVATIAGVVDEVMMVLAAIVAAGVVVAAIVVLVVEVGAAVAASGVDSMLLIMVVAGIVGAGKVVAGIISAVVVLAAIVGVVVEVGVLAAALGVDSMVVVVDVFARETKIDFLASVDRFVTATRVLLFRKVAVDLEVVDVLV